MKAPAWRNTPQPRNMKRAWSPMRLKSSDPHPPAEGLSSAFEAVPSNSQRSLRRFSLLWTKGVKWYMKWFIYWTADLKSSKLWSSQLWTQFKQLRIEAWKSQDFNGVCTRDLAIPVRRSNELNYEATDVGSWSFVSSNEPLKNGCEVINEMFHILNCGFEIK